MPFDPAELVDLVACDVAYPPRACCIPLPGGLEVCVLYPSIEATELEVLVQLFAQVNAALAPFAPLFNVLDVILAIVECIKALPKSILPPNPVPIVQCLVKLIEVVLNLLKLIPPFSLLFTVAALLDCLLLLISALRKVAVDLVERQARLIAAALTPVDPQAQFLITCEINNFNLLLASLNEYLKPLNRLIGVINFFLLFFGQEIPSFASGADNLIGLIATLDVAYTTVDNIRNFIPVPRAAT